MIFFITAALIRLDPRRASITSLSLRTALQQQNYNHIKNYYGSSSEPEPVTCTPVAVEGFSTFLALLAQDEAKHYHDAELSILPRSARLLGGDDGGPRSSGAGPPGWFGRKRVGPDFFLRKCMVRSLASGRIQSDTCKH